MSEIKIHLSGDIKFFTADDGSNLLSLIRENGFELYSPCGGNGTCGKCKVFVRGVGDVTSCMYKVTKDLEIVLPDKKEANILVSQYEHSLKIPFSPGEKVNQYPYPFGIAIDMGTTSIVFYFVNLVTTSVLEVCSFMNPQVKYGADVISRISYCIENKEGLKILQTSVISLINEQIPFFAEFASVTPDEIVKVTISGNTTMLHLFLGVDPSSLAFAPFIPVFTEGKVLTAGDLNLDCNPLAEVKILPSVSAYVGADIVGGLASIQPSEKFQNFLFIDIGTNGEMALVTPEKIYCCAAAAGPAFEGANISCGMGAFEGAISSYNKEGFITIGNAKPSGICGSGLLDVIATLLDKGIIQPDGFMEQEFIVISGDESSTGKSIILTPEDVREMQLAKSAIISGIYILLQEAGLEVNQIDALFLAGGFGNYLNVESALRTGLIPQDLKGKVISVGNTSGTGAVLALKSIYFDMVIEKLLAKTKYLELSTAENFPIEFAMNMRFPD
jgi:uncharacterized 2Fe-2S/4Fe-4S cluster protein (DUF4445 family)